MGYRSSLGAGFAGGALPGRAAARRARTRIPFGPVLLSRLPWLREHQLLHTDDTNEELVVIRAQHP
ncbi:hypothetical protein ACFYW1_13875 [Streptomyces sp. NPDC002669]|uniref:hypothetical protein n=1 Tax=Streptomyces sp. NPDC002669 TaxID=3364658 RepID=UPI00369C8FA6